MEHLRWIGEKACYMPFENPATPVWPGISHASQLLRGGTGVIQGRITDLEVIRRKDIPTPGLPGGRGETQIPTGGPGW